MGKEVTCRVLYPILEMIRSKAVPKEIWSKNVPYTMQYLQNKHERIEWKVYCSLMKNLTTVFSDTDFEEIGRIWAHSPLYRPWGMMTRLFFNLGKSIRWIQAGIQKAGNQFFSCIEFYLEDFGPNGFKVTLKVKDGYEFCREHFLFVKGAMSHVPGFRGYLDVNVTMQWLERGAVYENIYSKPMKTPSWIQKKIIWVFSAREAVREIIETHETLLQRYQDLEKARRSQQLLTKKLIESQERERKRIAGELHDSLGQNLLIICNEIQQYLQNPKSRKADLEQVSTLIKESIDETREIAQNLHPHQLERLGLTRAIQSMIKKIAHSSGIKFDEKIDDVDKLLPQPLEIHFYRIVQEGMSNIVKHSGATAIDFQVHRKPGMIQMILRDNGNGFIMPEEHPGKPETSGFGIADMKERSRLLNAELRILSEKGRGTALQLDIPLTNKDI